LALLPEREAMKKLRLMLTDICPRTCEGCCNKDINWSSSSIKRVTYEDAAKYEQVILTGGEPFSVAPLLATAVQYLRHLNPDLNIIVYTAAADHSHDILRLLPRIDGLTLTMHEQKDVGDLVRFDELLKQYLAFESPLSLRLNVFKGVRLPDVHSLAPWKIKKDIEWIKNCPFPEGESLGILLYGGDYRSYLKVYA
jgi:pyruvate-formate lyase-activating enzyme